MQTPETITLNYLPRLPKNPSIGIGCVGAGFIMADCHLVAYRRAGFNPVAIYSRTQARAQEVADRHNIPHVYAQLNELLANDQVEVIDVAVPPSEQRAIIEQIVREGKHVRGILAQKPIANSYPEAKEIVDLCADAGIKLAVNQNMRYDQSIRACKDALDRGYLGAPVLATIDMRAIPHWMPWQEALGYLTLRVMSIHHLDTFRYLFGDPERVYASVRPDPRTTFAHEDGICLYILEYANGLRAMSCDDVWTGPGLDEPGLDEPAVATAGLDGPGLDGPAVATAGLDGPAGEGAQDDIYIHWRVEGLDGMARGTIGWPSYPERVPSTIDLTTRQLSGRRVKPRWDEVWFPDAFVGTMAQLLCAVEDDTVPEISGADNLRTMALVDACYRSAKEHRAVALDEILP